MWTADRRYQSPVRLHVPYMRVKAVVSEQSSEVDDVVHVFVVVRFIGDENPPWRPTKQQ